MAQFVHSCRPGTGPGLSQRQGLHTNRTLLNVHAPPLLAIEALRVVVMLSSTSTLRQSAHLDRNPLTVRKSENKATKFPAFANFTSRSRSNPPKAYVPQERNKRGYGMCDPPKQNDPKSLMGEPRAHRCRARCSRLLRHLGSPEWVLILRRRGH